MEDGRATGTAPPVRNGGIVFSRLLQLGRAVRYVWLVLGITVLLFAIIETVLSTGFEIYDRHTTKPDPRVAADAHGNAPWVNSYYQEFLTSRDDVRWMPYVYWRRTPRQGPYINIDDRGIRATTPGSPTGLKIYMFGGSTMWGTGARDDYTIPSMLSKELQRKGVAASITNFGESGWVSFQSHVALQLELREGRRPDLVIFYDGVNDTFAGFQQGVAGRPHNESNRVAEFNFLRKPLQQRLAMAAADIARRLSARRFVRLLTSPANEVNLTIELEKAAPGARSDPAAKERLARQVIDAYASTVELVQALGDRYQFKSLFYWQPTVSHKPEVTPFE